MVKTHAENCLVCNKTKPINAKPQGLLKNLQIADGPWSSLSVNFITDLPLSENYTGIMVVVDRFTKWAEFFPVEKTITAQETTKIFMNEIFSRHGLPTEIISDKGPQFVSSLFTGVLKNLNI